MSAPIPEDLKEVLELVKCGFVSFGGKYAVSLIERIATLEAALAEAQWKPITPDSLPKLGDEVWIEDSFFAPGLVSIVTDPDLPIDYWRCRATHYRPINPPEVSNGK